MRNQIKLGITEWSLPVDGPYGCKIAAEVGFEGVQLDVGSYARNFPKSKRCVQNAYLEAAEKLGIQYTAIACKANVAEMVEPLMPYICQVHVKDGYKADVEPSGALLGEGASGFYKTIDKLREYGYTGWLISENFYDRGPISHLNEDPVELMIKDYHVLRDISW